MSDEQLTADLDILQRAIDARKPATDETHGTVQVVINGEYFSARESSQRIIDQFREAMDRDTAVVIGNINETTMAVTTSALRTTPQNGSAYHVQASSQYPVDTSWAPWFWGAVFVVYSLILWLILCR